uniref:L-serine ammonia-lyase n=1 Tax=Vibrio sp. TaxID=678 RepID=UPI003D10415F
MLSIFDIYKIGVGPSSSHTNGPMIAGYQFANAIQTKISHIARLQVDLYGSLSLTGVGHHTDRAVILGLLGNRPDSIDIGRANLAMVKAVEEGMLVLNGEQDVRFDYQTDMLFHQDNLPLHENGMTISAFDSQGKRIGFETYYSIGGGFVATADELENGSKEDVIDVEFPFSSAEEMLNLAEQNGLSIGRMVLKNELAFQPAQAIDQKAEQIWAVMESCMSRGFETEGILAGGLNVTRRAPGLLKQLEANAATQNDPMEIMDWVNVFAFAVSEENAAGGQVVTSPTNGAAGVI